MLEFAIVLPILLTLLVGMIFFGLALNTKQDVTRAAAEGARAGAVEIAPPPGSIVAELDDPRYIQALLATQEAVEGFYSSGCTSEVLCHVDLHDCEIDPAWLAPSTTGYGEGNLCVSVRISYEGYPAGNSVPFVGSVIPERFVSASTARVNQ